MIILCLTTIVANSQTIPEPLVNIGDAAPPFRVHDWMKNTLVNAFEKGKVYVLEFWSAMEKAIEKMKGMKDKSVFLQADLPGYEAKPREYKKM